MIPAKSLDDLGWSALLEQLAGRARTQLGAASLRELDFCAGADQAEGRIAAVTEARALAAAGKPLPIGGIRDLAGALDRARKGGVLEAAELVAIGQTAAGCHQLRAHLDEHGGAAPRLAAVAGGIQDLGHVFHPIAEAFDADGRLHDHASDALGPLRRRVAQVRARLQARVDDLLGDPDVEGHLQDDFVTQRDDRWVLPIKASSRFFVKGIVHGSSQSGHTVFIEPEVIIELNNELALAHSEVADEERRIHALLTAYVAEEADALAEAVAAAVELDRLAAAARLADDLRASAPIIDRGGVLAVRQVRHPLMVLAGRRCVANDVELPAHGVLLISGPNAGGKTVALKSVGLAVLMARAGLHVAAGLDSRIPWVSSLGTDIGDAQNLDKDLSTFSAHLDQLRRFFAEVDRGGLLLLDEVAAGTDPEQGAALARAVLEGFADRGVAILATTHYEALKALPAGDPRFVNASVGFDLDRMEPTFKLHLGVPGSSGALHVARRMGLPAPVVARAEELLGEPRARVEGILAELEEQRRRLEEERLALEQARQQAEAARRAAEHEKEEARRIERKLREGAHGEALAALRQARLEVDEVRKTVKRRRRDEDLAGAKRELDTLAGKVAAHAPDPDLPGMPARREQLVAGCRVYVTSLGKVGDVAEVPERGKILVMVGALRSSVDVGELRLVSSREAASFDKARTSGKSSGRPGGGAPAVKLVTSADAQRAPMRTGDTTCDVRGERVDDAVAAVDRFIDDSMRMSRDCIFVVHGHGTGALRTAVREHLRRHPVIARFRSGEPEEGGDGVTVAWLDV